MNNNIYKSLIIILISILNISIAYSHTIKVHIKGFDDGIMTTKRNDYLEAVLFAKREAVERAGCKIESFTTIENLILKQSYIESKASAILLLGYDIVDNDYSRDGYYQITLIGEIWVKNPQKKVNKVNKVNKVSGNSLEKDKNIKIDKYGTLCVTADPTNAKIRILNIKPIFVQGMKLKSGRYLIEVSANNYITQKKWVEVIPEKKTQIDIKLSFDIIPKSVNIIFGSDNNNSIDSETIDFILKQISKIVSNYDYKSKIGIFKNYKFEKQMIVSLSISKKNSANLSNLSVTLNLDFYDSNQFFINRISEKKELFYQNKETQEVIQNLISNFLLTQNFQKRIERLLDSY